MKLAAITLPSVVPDQIRAFPRTLRFALPPDAILGWSISIRGPGVFLISPPGWAPGIAVEHRPADGEVHAFELARSACILEWTIDSSADIDKVQKFDSPVIKRQGVPEGEVAA